MGIKLGEICKFQSGGTPSKGSVEYFNGDIPWITTTALNGSKIDTSDAIEWITNKAIRESAAKIVPAFSIMVGTRVGVGKVAINTVDMSTSQDIISLIGIDESIWCKDFLCKYLQGKSAYLNSQARGATIKGIKIDVLAALELPTISLDEQKHISVVIDTTKHIINARQQELEKLDELVKARFVEMFGDPNNTGMVSENKYRIGELCDVTKLAGFEFTEYINYQDSGEIIMLRGLNCKQGKLILDNVKYIDRETSHKLPRSRLYKGDILMTYAGTIGDVAMVDEDDKYHLAPNVAKISIADKEKVNPTFLVHLFMYSHDYIMTFASQVAQASINMQKIRDFEYIIPSIEEQIQFEHFVKQVDKSKVVVQKALDKAQTLFDSLMQQYFG